MAVCPVATDHNIMSKKEAPRLSLGEGGLGAKGSRLGDRESYRSWDRTVYLQAIVLNLKIRKSSVISRLPYLECSLLYTTVIESE